MAEITAITPQVKDKTRCNIYVDGTFYCGLSLETAVKNRLKVGSVVSGEELSAMQLESEKRSALDKALTHITRSMKTEKEVRDYLKRKGYLEEVAEYVVGKMKEYSYLDDGAYAETYAQSAVKRKGKKMISLELKRKGVSDEEISAALTDLQGEEESAQKLLEKYFRGKVADEKTMRKAYAYLLGKGYDYETAKNALKKYGDTDED